MGDFMRRLALALLLLCNPAWGQDSAPSVAAAPASPPQERPAAKCLPYHPPSAVRAGAEGTAIILVHISETGTVSGIELLQSTGDAGLDENTLACATERWRFKPAMVDGKPVATSRTFTIRYSLAPTR